MSFRKIVEVIIFLFIGVLIGFIARPYIYNPPTPSTIIPEPDSIKPPEVIQKLDDEYYKKLLKASGLNMGYSNHENITGSGEQVITISVGEDCGSCHYKEVHIYDKQQEIFVFYGDDPSIDPIYGKGFVITQPVRKSDESYSNPSEFQSAIFLWNSKTFVKNQSTQNWVDSSQTPG